MKECQDCGDDARRRIRCPHCKLLVCSHCYHHIHRCEPGHTKKDCKGLLNKPTIAELEKILDNDEDRAIEILPNGEIRAKTKKAREKVITMKENLGGEYAFTLD